MSVEFNHTIVWSHDSKASAAFLAAMLGLSARGGGVRFRWCPRRTASISISWTKKGR